MIHDFGITNSLNLPLILGQLFDKTNEVDLKEMHDTCFGPDVAIQGTGENAEGPVPSWGAVSAAQRIPKGAIVVTPTVKSMHPHHVTRCFGIR